MRTVIYGPADDAPEGHRFVAHIFYVEDKPKPHTAALPVMIFGSTAERARERAEAHIAEYIEKAKPREPRRKKATPVTAEVEIEEVI